jgi:hypothetical protein
MNHYNKREVLCVRLDSIETDMNILRRLSELPSSDSRVRRPVLATLGLAVSSAVPFELPPLLLPTSLVVSVCSIVVSPFFTARPVTARNTNCNQHSFHFFSYQAISLPFFYQPKGLRSISRYSTGYGWMVGVRFLVLASTQPPIS